MFLNQSLHRTHSEEKTLNSKGYKLLRCVGEGGYSKVYLGEFIPEKSDIPVQLACKIIETKKVPKRFLQKFFPRELQMLIKLNHPHIIQIHSIFHRKNKYYIFMRYAERGDLYEHIKKYGVIQERRARFWVRQIALALQYIHTLEIAHRDLKCENILITQNYNVKLSDFGFARHTITSDFRRELSETFCGSITYVAPEVLSGQPYPPKVADLWSFGVIIYIMVNAAYPFQTNNTKKLVQLQLEKNWKFKNPKNFSSEIKILITNLIEPDIYKRYKIEDVIDSQWIAMDDSLKRLTSYEFKALTEAVEYARSAGFTSEYYEGPRRRIFSSVKKIYLSKNTITFLKRHDDAFLHSIP